MNKKITSNTVNRYGIVTGVWLSYHEAEKETFNKIYHLVTTKKEQLVNEFEEKERAFIEQNFDKFAVFTAKFFTEVKIP